LTKTTFGGGFDRHWNAVGKNKNRNF